MSKSIVPTGSQQGSGAGVKGRDQGQGSRAGIDSSSRGRGQGSRSRAGVRGRGQKQGSRAGVTSLVIRDQASFVVHNILCTTKRRSTAC